MVTDFEHTDGRCNICGGAIEVHTVTAEGVACPQSLYTVDPDKQTFVSATCSMVGDTVRNNANTTYEAVIKDLCLCMVQAIDLDHSMGKQAIGQALHTVLSSVLSS